jgi:hypothetical protein
LPGKKSFELGPGGQAGVVPMAGDAKRAQGGAAPDGIHKVEVVEQAGYNPGTECVAGSDRVNFGYRKRRHRATSRAVCKPGALAAEFNRHLGGP